MKKAAVDRFSEELALEEAMDCHNTDNYTVVVVLLLLLMMMMMYSPAKLMSITRILDRVSSGQCHALFEEVFKPVVCSKCRGMLTQ